MHVVLRGGFRGHTVALTLNERRVFFAAGVITDPMTASAGAIFVSVPKGTARLAVSVSPGDLGAALDVDVAAHPHVAISLVGEGTLAFETSAVSLP